MIAKLGVLGNAGPALRRLLGCVLISNLSPAIDFERLNRVLLGCLQSLLVLVLMTNGTIYKWIYYNRNTMVS